MTSPNTVHKNMRPRLFAEPQEYWATDARRQYPAISIEPLSNVARRRKSRMGAIQDKEGPAGAGLMGIK